MSSVSVVFYTVAHRIDGQLLVRERLSERLNDPLTDFLELTGVSITSLTHENAAPVRWAVATIPKQSILVATLDNPEGENRQSRIDKVQVKRGSQVGAIVGSIEVYGTGHIVFTGAPQRVLTTQLSPFFPVTDATILLSQRIAENRIQSPVALVNRSMVQAFTLG